jgi:hypothetical protein
MNSPVDCRSLRVLRPLLSVLFAVSCERTAVQHPHVEALRGLEPDTQLLLNPTGDPEALLGRVVTADPGGGWVVADARAPGCEVGVRRVQSHYAREVLEDTGRVASLSLGREQLASLSAKYGKRLRKYAKIENVEVLEADLRGPCGEHVIRAVKVGTGTSELGYFEERGAGVEVPTGHGDVGAKAESWRRVNATLRWDTPQAWAFTVGASGTGGAVDLVVHMPDMLAHGQAFAPEIEVKRSVWLVVLYEAADGSVGVLLPATGAPVQQALAGERVVLPSFTAEAVGAAQTHERLRVYGFVERGDFDQFRPPAGALSSEQAKRYASELPERLRAIPQRRWVRTEFGYVIDGAQAPPGEGR